MTCYHQLGSAANWAPGSSMLFGEYAVTQGARALVVPLNKGVTAEVKLYSDHRVHKSLKMQQVTKELIEALFCGQTSLEIQLNGPLGRRQWSITHTALQREHRGHAATWEYGYAKCALIHFLHHLKTKVDAKLSTQDSGQDESTTHSQVAGDGLSTLYRLEIDSVTEFDLQWGLGSSSAFLVAFLRSLNVLFYANLLEEEIFNIAKSSCHQVQGGGSCCDIATSLIGDVIVYQQAFVSQQDVKDRKNSVPSFFQQISYEEMCFRTQKSKNQCVFNGSYYALLNSQHSNPLKALQFTWLYMGYKTTTAKMLQRIVIDSEDCLLSDRIVLDALEALRRGDIDAFFACYRDAHALLEGLGCCDAPMKLVFEKIQDISTTAPIKVSGSGRGDCLIGIESQPLLEQVVRSLKEPNTQLAGLQCLENITVYSAADKESN